MKKFSYNLALQQVKKIYNNEGFKFFWRGNLANISRAFPYSALVNFIK